jgi:hypothetical protein
MNDHRLYQRVSDIKQIWLSTTHINGICFVVQRKLRKIGLGRSHFLNIGEEKDFIFCGS